MRYLLIVLLLIPFEVLSQTTKRQARPDTAKSDPTSAAIRQDALSVADQVIDQIKEVEDLRSRVALTEQVVRLLLKKRPERLRKLLDTIFDDAIALSEQSKTKSVPPDLDSILRRIIQGAALIDIELARGYIETLANVKAPDGTARSTSDSAVLHLRIATELTRSNPSLAVEVASRTLNDAILPDTLLFLASLRQVDTAAANRFFITALQRCQARGAKDVNELLLLSSYVFSPLQVPTVVSQGLAILNIPGYDEVAKNYEVDPGLARQFVTVTSEILLNPQRYSAGSIETLTLGAEGDFYALSIIEPWVATYEPGKAPAISAQRNTVMSYLQATQRETASSNADRWKNAPKNQSLTSGATQTTVEYLVSRAESASDPKRKDQLYFRAALMAVRVKKHELALSLVERISAEYADRAKQFIRFDIAQKDIQNQEFLEADKLARADDVLVRRAYIFTLIADSLTKDQHKETSRAFQYLDEVQQLAGKLSDEKEKLSVLIGAGNVYARLDTVRASEILQQIIKQTKRIEEFVGDSSIANVLDISGFYFDYSLYSNGLTIFDLIKRLAPVSYYGTLQDIRSFKNRTLRLQAILALCSAVIADENVAALSSVNHASARQFNQKTEGPSTVHD